MGTLTANLEVRLLGPGKGSHKVRVRRVKGLGEPSLPGGPAPQQTGRSVQGLCYLWAWGALI